MNQVPKHKLGRTLQFDERNTNYHIRKLLPPGFIPRSMFWVCDTWLNQGNVGSCVGNSFAHDLASNPIPVKNVTEEVALKIYYHAQSLDGIPGVHEGTSVLAGIKSVQALYPDSSTGYHWAFNVNDLILTLSHVGPVILGINWYTGFFTPDSSGEVHKTGIVEGGHAILCNYLDTKRRGFWLHNSWGIGWGKAGTCFMSYDVLSQLLNENGEACVPTGRQLVII